MRLLLYVEAAPMEGADVRAWQDFLIRQLGLSWAANSRFGPKTRDATSEFQRRHGLGVDGKVGDDTVRRARELGFVEPGASGGPTPVGPKPVTPTPATPGTDPSLVRSDLSAPTSAFIEANFGGRFDYRDIPGKDEINILGGWEGRNVEDVPIPQLDGVPYYSIGYHLKNRGRVRFNRRGAEQLRALWRAWDDAGLVGRVLTYGGGFNARYKRDSAKRRYTDLSNHAYGTAFDINESWNGLGKTPAAFGRQGSVRELVQIANQHGFHWGGHYDGRKDGMHFELARLL